MDPKPPTQMQQVPVEAKPVDLRIQVTLLRGDKTEGCCNYDITGRHGNMLLVLPAMTHIQDMPR